MNIALILAGGSGSRMRDTAPEAAPKQYRLINGQPLILYSLKVFQNNPNISDIYITADSDRHKFLTDCAEEHGITKLKGFAVPGENRQMSVYNGLRAIKAAIDDAVLVHDAARPFVTDEIIERLVAALPEYDGAMPSVSVTDTVYRSGDGVTISALLPRDELFAGQTPEIFKYGMYLAAHEQCGREEILKTRGSSEIAFKGGMRIKIVAGDPHNVKITTAKDLEVFGKVQANCGKDGNTMKAWVLNGTNDLRLTELPPPVPKDDEILVQVMAAGICSSDIPRVYGGGAYHYPIILGHEFSGVTTDGRRVGIFPLIPCRKCRSCLLGQYETCTNYSYIGSRRDGAFAEYVAVPEWNLLLLPDDVSFEQAAMLEPAAVALHAVHMLGNVTNAAVIGDGVIGKLIAKWLSIFEIDAVVLGRKDADTTVQYDACVEAVGSADAFARAIKIVKPNGQIVLVGNPNDDFNIGKLLYWQILRKQLTVRGSWNSSYKSDWNEVVENMNKLRLDGLISHRYGFDELDKAFAMMHEKREKYCKVMISKT